MKPAVILFVYNRVEHTKNAWKALNQCIASDDLDLYVFSDGSKNESDNDSILKIRKYIKDNIPKTSFRTVTLYEEESNKGLASSVINGVSKLIEQYGSVIVIEDDLIVSKNFLQYMRNALIFYGNDKRIWSISGYTPDFEGRLDIKDDVYFHYRGCSWGWGTWKDRWEMVDWNVSDYNKFIFNKSKRKRFNRGSADLSEMLDRYMRHEIDSWAIRWCYAESKNDKVTVYPKYNLVYNAGMDGSGTHSTEKDVNFACELEKEKKMNFKVYEDIDLSIIYAFNNNYKKKMNPFVFFKHRLGSVYKRLKYKNQYSI